MVRIKMGFLGLSIPAKIERSRLIISNINANPGPFPTPDPSTADGTLITDATEVAYNDASNGDKVKKATMRLRVKELMDYHRRLSAYVLAESGGDEEIILVSGYDVVRRGSPLTVEQVVNLRVVPGKTPGSIRVFWKRTAGAYAYQVQISETGLADSFELARIAIGTRVDLMGLVPGKVYYIRVGAVGREVYGAWSDVGTVNARIS